MTAEYLDLVLSVMTHPLYVMAGIGCFANAMALPIKDLNIIVKMVTCIILGIVWPIGLTSVTIEHLRRK